MGNEIQRVVADYCNEHHLKVLLKRRGLNKYAMLLVDKMESN